MAKTVWKSIITMGGKTLVDLPKDAEPISVDVQFNSYAVMWSIVDPEAEIERISVFVAWTGEPLPVNIGKFIGTFTNKGLVHHTFVLKSMTFGPRLQEQLRNLSQYIAADCRHEDTESIAEICCDANRLTMRGFPELDAQVSQYINDFGYEAMIAEAARHIRQ